MSGLRSICVCRQWLSTPCAAGAADAHHHVAEATHHTNLGVTRRPQLDQNA